jgi:hypothetical protein
MKKIKYQKPKMTKRKIVPRFLLRRSAMGFGSDDIFMSAVWAATAF